VESAQDSGVRLRAMQGQLGEEGVLIRYACRESLCGAFIVTNDSVAYQPFQTDCRQLYAMLSRLYFLITQTSDSDSDEKIIETIIGELSRLIWHPLERYIRRCEEPYLITDGILDRLPFLALTNQDGSRLFQRHLWRILAGIPESHDIYLKNDRPASVSQCAILRPAADLPGGDLEGKVVKRYLPEARVYSGTEAGSEKLRACLEIDNGLVHLIAHAAQSYENHLFSTILLGDGPFYPFDLYSSPVRSRLVVLSGCQTGDPGLSYNGDSVSLAHSFLSAGAQEVLASYWPISDEATGLLMEAFYKGIAGGSSHSVALKNAMSDMITATARFKHWAGFYLIRRR